MVWKNFKNDKKIKKLRLKLNVVNRRITIKPAAKSVSKEKTLLEKSGIINDINRLTGNKVKDAFIERIFKKLNAGSLIIKKNFLKKQINNKNNNIFDKRYKKLRKKLKKLNKIDVVSKQFAKDKLVRDIKDNSRIVANDDFFDFKKNITNYITKSLYKPTINNQKWNLMFSNAMISKTQNNYFQSNFNRIDKNLIDSPKLENLLEGKEILNAQNESTFSNFIRQNNYKNLLFRSFWFNKFISTIIKCGKKQRVWKYVLKSMSFLKTEFGRSPILMLFEILELYRIPVKGLNPKSLTRKVVVRTHLVSWWKQYTQILRWIRHSLLGQNKNHISWGTRIRSEIYNLLFDTGNTLIRKRIEANAQLIAFGRVALHFRWHRRYSKRAVRAIKVLDKKFYN